MKFLKKYFPGKSLPLNFESLLIITYGRSGSTLLQGVLNSIDGVLVRGENNNFIFHLYKAHQAVLAAKKHYGKADHNPFFGAELLDEKYLLNQLSHLVKDMLLADHTVEKSGSTKKLFFDRHKNESKINCYGFKEVRYLDILNDVPGYLAFLEKVFPNPCFVFNTRNKEAVMKSMLNVGWFQNKSEAHILNKLKQTENVFLNFLESHKQNSFHITYEDVVGKSDKLAELFSFIGATYEETKLDKVLSEQHSYKPVQKKIKCLPKNNL